MYLNWRRLWSLLISVSISSLTTFSRQCQTSRRFVDRSNQQATTQQRVAKWPHDVTWAVHVSTCQGWLTDQSIRGFLRMSRRMNTFGKACSNKFCMVCEWNTLSSLSMISKITDWKFHAQFNIMFPCLLACISYYQLRWNVSNIYNYMHMSERWRLESQGRFP